MFTSAVSNVSNPPAVETNGTIAYTAPAAASSASIFSSSSASSSSGSTICVA